MTIFDETNWCGKFERTGAEYWLGVAIAKGRAPFDPAADVLAQEIFRNLSIAHTGRTGHIRGE